MKKLLNILSTISIVGAASTSVIACGSNNNLSLSTTVDDAVQLLAITNLNTNMLVQNKVKLGGNVSKEKIDELIQLLNLESKMQNSAIGPRLWLSFRVCLMANQLLGNISTSVPNYGWINSKVQWQSSRWGFNQLFNLSSEQAIGMNMSGWLVNDEEYSLSVTFLESDLTGWKGTSDPAFARININKRIVVNSSGIIDVAASNPFGIWLNESNNSNNLSAVDIVQSTNVSQTKNRGNVYQGFVNSSSLIDLKDIYDSSDDSIPSSVFTFTPSVMDFVNNMFIESEIINKILANSQEEIAQNLNEYLLDDPVYIGENVTLEHVERRIRNQIFITLFKNVLHRRDSENDFAIQDITYADAIISSWWTQLRAQLYEVSNYTWVSETDADRLTTFREATSDYATRDVKGELTAEEIETITAEIKFMVGISKQPNSFNAVEIDFANTTFKTQFKFAKTSLAINQSKEPIAIQNMFSLVDFGANNSRELVVTYYYEKNNSDADIANRLVYQPDAGKDPTAEVFVSDAGFKNVFATPRMNYILPIYSKAVLESYKDGYYFNESSNQSLLLANIFDLTKAENLTSFNEGSSAISTDDWFTQAGFIEQFEVSSKNELSIAMLSQLVSLNVTKKMKDIFNVESTGEADLGNIWENGISFDNFVEGTIVDTNLVPESVRDDDIAFAQLIQQSNFIAVSDLNASGVSDFRSAVWDEGIKARETSFNVVINTVDSYGNIFPVTTEPNIWWQNVGMNSFNISVLLDLYSTSNPELENHFISYWDKWVRNNTQNHDHKIISD